MRHRYECPLRWADLDMLGHINNVVYVDYLQEARVDMMRLHSPGARAPELGEGLVVARHEITYLVPLHFRHRPVSIECWVTEIRAASFTMAYEIFDETPEGRVVYVRATTLLTPFLFTEERPRRLRADEKETLQRFLEPSWPTSELAHGRDFGADPRDQLFEIPVRFSDVDVYGHVNNVQYLTYLQEARISVMAGISAAAGSTFKLVVAQTNIDYLRPLLLRPEPYRSWTRLERLGGKSLQVSTEIQDEDGSVLARGQVVMVFFDTESERAVPPSDEVRALLAPMVFEPTA